MYGQQNTKKLNEDIVFYRCKSTQHYEERHIHYQVSIWIHCFWQEKLIWTLENMEKRTAMKAAKLYNGLYSVVVLMMITTMN